MVESLPASGIDLLFVYGTLRRGFALHHHLRRIGAVFVSAGKVQAELFDLGKFPGARKSAKPWKTVEGDIYRLRRPANALKVLDQVEGFSLQHPDKGLFWRARTDATLPNGERRMVWIYWLNKRVRARVSGDRWAR